MISFAEHASRPFDAELRTLFTQFEQFKTHLHRFIALTQLSVEDGVDRTAEARSIDKSVNTLEFEVDQQVTRLISKHAPMADELRIILAAVKVAAACENAADKLKNTIKRVARQDGLKASPQAGVFLSMLDKVAGLLDRSLERFGELEDTDMLRILEEREAIHALYKQGLVGLAPDAQTINLSFAFRNIERVAELSYDIAKIGYAARHNRKYAKPDALA